MRLSSEEEREGQLDGALSSISKREKKDIQDQDRGDGRRVVSEVEEGVDGCDR